MSKGYIEKEAAVEIANDIISYLNDLYNDGWLTITDADWRVLMGMLLSVANISPAKVAPVARGDEMTAREYIYISNRMLKEDYRAWDRLMVFEENDDADKAIAWAKEWMREHPEERSEE